MMLRGAGRWLGEKEKEKTPRMPMNTIILRSTNEGEKSKNDEEGRR